MRELNTHPKKHYSRWQHMILMCKSYINFSDTKKIKWIMGMKQKFTQNSNWSSSWKLTIYNINLETPKQSS